MVGTCKSLIGLLGASLTAAACLANPANGLATHRDPLAFVPVDGGSVAPQTGFNNRDAVECGLTTGSPNCQDWTRTIATGGRSSDLVPIAAIADDFKAADNFTVTANQTLTSICFWGFYVGTTNAAGANGAPTAGNEAFRIRVYNNQQSGATPGLPGTLVKEWTVGANAGYSLTVDPNTSLTRFTTGTATRVGVYAWTVQLNGAAQVALTPGCYWLEVVGATAGIPEGARLRWANVNVASPSNDGVIVQGLISAGLGFTYADLVGGPTNSTDLAFCLNFALNTNNCNIIPAPANNSCATAQTVTAPFTATNVNTLRSLTPVAPFCGNNPVNGNALWYKVAGTGDTFTASTCGGNTSFDTVINVYCGTCTGLNCVANNDTGPATCTGATGSDPSQVSFATVSGTDYYIAVFGFELDAGFIDFSLTSAAGTPAAPCASDRCAVNITGVTPTETDACFTATVASNNSACNGATVGTFTFGDDFAGTSSNIGNTRDFDFWELASPIPDTVGDGTAWLDVVYSVEFPGLFNFFTGACNAPTNNGTFLGGAFANYLDGGPACPRAAAARTIQLNTPAGAPFRLNLFPIDFGGVPCATGNNNYIITVTLSAVGACCVPAQACFLTVAGDCADQGGNFLANSTSCTPSDPCSAPVQGACCSGTTCALNTSANCTGANTAYKGDNSVCGAGNTFAGCCKADFNQSGTVTVQDIFDFLAAYFTGSPLANINGVGGVTVQDIFDYLAAYFANCT